MPHQTKQQEPVPLVLRPAVAAVNIGAKAVSAFTGVSSDRVKKTAGSILRGEQRSIKTLKEELNLANKLIEQLEKQVIEATEAEIALSADLVQDAIVHAIPPSLDAEYNVEKQLANVLQERLRDTELAEEYKKSTKEQEIYFAGVIESLQEDLKKELAVIENQENDKNKLERAAAACRNNIDKLKEELERQRNTRETDLREQKRRYKDQQRRISDEIRTATDFCNDLRRKLEAEVVAEREYVERNSALAYELEVLQKLNQENLARLQTLATELQEQKHRIALLNQERQRASEASKGSIAKLREQVKVVEDRILIIENKGAEKLAAQLKKMNEEKDEIISKFEKEIKALEEEAEADLTKYLEEYKINTTTIEQLREKDTADVEKEVQKAEGEYKKLNNANTHAIQRLQSKLNKLKNEVATTAKLATVLNEQIDFEKKTFTRLDGRANGLRGEVMIAQQQTTALVEKLNEFEKQLQHEREQSAKQLELVRNAILKEYETRSNVINASFENEKKRLQEELEIAKKVALDAARRLNETRKELEEQITLLKNDIREFASRKLAAEEAAQKADVKLDELQTTLRTTALDVANWEQLLKDEKIRSSNAEKKLNAETQRTKEAADLDHDKVAELEAELHSSKNLVGALKAEEVKEEEAKKRLEEGVTKQREELTKQIAQLQEEIRRVQAEAETERNTANRFEIQLRSSQTKNSHLKTRVDAQNQAKQDQVSESKEVHNTQVQVVERK